MDQRETRIGQDFIIEGILLPGQMVSAQFSIVMVTIFFSSRYKMIPFAVSTIFFFLTKVSVSSVFSVDSSCLSLP